MSIQKISLKLCYLFSFVLFLPILGALFLIIYSWMEITINQNIALNISLFNFLISLILWVEFDNSTSKFQFFENYTSFQKGEFSFSTFNLIFGIDGISLFFIILTTFLIPVCILVSWTSITAYVKEYCIAFLILESYDCCILVLDLLTLLYFF